MPELYNKIGIMGGTFNPIHYGHLRAAETAREAFGLEKVLFIPSGNPPHKPKGLLAGAEDRYAMVKGAISTNPYFEASRIEIDRVGSSYSVDTLKELKKTYGSQTRFYFIIGADIFPELVTWKNYKVLAGLCEFIVVHRPGYDASEGSLTETFTVHFLEMPLMDISSSDVRERLIKSKSIKYLVPECVEEYLIKNRVYLQEE